MLSCSMDGTVRLWGVSTSACYRVYRSHAPGAWVKSVLFTPDGRGFVSAGLDHRYALLVHVPLCMPSRVCVCVLCVVHGVRCGGTEWFCGPWLLTQNNQRVCGWVTMIIFVRTRYGCLCVFHEPGLAHPQPGHACNTVALAAHGQSLLSTGRDCKLRHWNLAIASTKPHPHGGAKPGANTPSAEDVPAEQRARSGNLSSGLRWERTMPMSAWYGATL